MRLRDAWAQLARRYARPLEEDDIIDLREVKILKDRGVVRNLHAQVRFGKMAILDEPVNDASSEVGGMHSEDDDDIDEIDALSHAQAQGVRVRNRLEAQLRRVKPLRRDLDSEDEDEDDLHEFLEAERRTREEFGPVDEGEDEDDVDFAQLRDNMEERSGDWLHEVIEISGSSDEECDDEELRTFTTNAREDEDCDDDPLGDWVHDESTAIYEVVRASPPPDHEVIEIFDTPPSSPPPSSPSSMSDPFSVRSSIRASSP